MQIDIRARSFPLTDAIRAYVARRLAFALSARDARIDSVVATLSDVNGPRGGRDKRCRLRVLMPGHPDVVIEDTEADLYKAIGQAIGRAARAVARRLDRDRRFERRRVEALLSG